MRHYLDHNATSPLSEAARAALLDVLDAGPGNAGSTHTEGRAARARLESARRDIARAIAAPGGQVVFCSGATEANNLALLGGCDGRPVVLSSLEHPSVRALATELRARGAEVRWLPHDSSGRIDLSAADRLLAGAGLCAVMAANNELGNQNPVAEIGRICAARGVAFHIDAAQIAGRWDWKIPSGATSVALSAHKAGGPVGVGALWLARGVAVRPLHLGGHQERGVRPGTEPVALAAAMAAVYKAPDPRWARLAEIRDAIEAVVMAGGGLINGDPDARIANTLNFSWPGLDAETALMALDLAGFALSAGSACTAGSIEPSPVVAALGHSAERTAGALRISLGPEHASCDAAGLAEQIVEVLASAVARSAGLTRRPAPPG